MTTYLDPGQVLAFDAAAAAFKQAQQALANASLAIISVLGNGDNDPAMLALAAMTELDNRLAGFGYTYLTVQSEWTGGDGNLNRAPHGCQPWFNSLQTKQGK